MIVVVKHERVRVSGKNRKTVRMFSYVAKFDKGVNLYQYIQNISRPGSTIIHCHKQQGIDGYVVRKKGYPTIDYTALNFKLLPTNSAFDIGALAEYGKEEDEERETIKEAKTYPKVIL